MGIVGKIKESQPINSDLMNKMTFPAKENGLYISV